MAKDTEKPDKTRSAKVLETAPIERKAEDDVTRFTIPLDRAGRPIVEKMRETTRAQLAAIVSDPAVPKALGLTPAGASILPPSVIGALVTALGVLQGWAIARITDAPRAIVEAIAPYTPEEVEAITPSFSAVLAKYGGPVIGQYGDELALVVLLGSLTQRKVELVIAAMDRQAAERAKTIASQANVAPAPIAPGSDPS